MQPYDHTRSAFVAIKGGEQLGIVGEYKATVRKNLKLPVYTAGFEISLDALVTAQASLARYTALPRFPKVTQDITMRVPAAVAYNELNAFVAGFVQGYKDGAYFTTVQGTDIYQGEDTAYKNFSFRITAASYERTLTDDEVNAMLEAAAVAAHEQFGAERL
jgi:phenylalanyl-tRNA synthetase beta chain